MTSLVSRPPLPPPLSFSLFIFPFFLSFALFLPFGHAEANTAVTKRERERRWLQSLMGLPLDRGGAFKTRDGESRPLAVVVFVVRMGTNREASIQYVVYSNIQISCHVIILILFVSVACRFASYNSTTVEIPRNFITP